MDDVDIFLEHHGVKGQKWGIQNKKASAPQSSKSHVSKKKKAIIGIASLAAVTAITAAILSKKGNTPIQSPTIVKTISEGKVVHEKIMKEIAEKNIRLISEANDHLRINDNNLNIPHPQRVVLKTDYWKKILDRE